MSEVKEPCGKCKHPLSSHTKDTRRKAGTMTVDPALIPPKQYDIRSDRPVGEAGCTECECPAWEPAGSTQFTPGAINEGVPTVPQPTKPSVSPGDVGHWNHPEEG